IVGARPGIGKTIVAVQAAVGLGVDGYVSFTSLEMSGQELTNRIIAQVAEVALGRLEPKPGEHGDRLTARDWEHIAEARPRLSSLHVEFNDGLASTMADVRNHAKAIRRKAESKGSHLSAVIV